MSAKVYLQQGIQALEQSRYDEAVIKLTIAQAEFELLQDYALFYLAETFHKIEKHGRSLDTFRVLLDRHPESPLVRKARMAEIREALEEKEDNLLQLFKSYVSMYPSDEEISFKYGMFLKESGNEKEAISIFKKIYIAGGLFSNMSLRELPPSSITVSDRIERASSLKKAYAFREAEHELRTALSHDTGKYRNTILKELANVLFRQKKYHEAASLFDKIDDHYYTARSLFRAGDMNGFELALQDLLSTKNRKAGVLLVALAHDSRRSKDYEKALELYQEALRQFPNVRESANWGIGWTSYLTGAYEKAADILSKLYAIYDDPKYLYWRARSVEASGEDASGLFDELMQMNDNYYSFLATVRTGAPLVPSVPWDELSVQKTSQKQKFKRVEALQSINMTKEATWELIPVSKKITSPEDFLYIVSKFQQLGEFKRALSMSGRITYSEQLHYFWYPLAFWDIIEPLAKKYSFDPFIILSVIREESHFDASAQSVAGARGLMQLMPQTAYRLDKTLKLGIKNASQIHDVQNNIHLGVYYLKSLLNEFHSVPHVLAAYNAGKQMARNWENRRTYASVDEFIEDISYPETRKYVKKVLHTYFQYRKFSFPESDTTVPESMPIPIFK
ncbi:MAG: transglycosylase SLT domain-containing protein [Nitrospiraceae bacterium]|nr:MAG: transglycosylase SLT domain-containing protein [Nitrospiraceae bacterium]